MNLNDMLVSYKLVDMPVFDRQEEQFDLPTPLDNYTRATLVTKKEQPLKEDKFDWGMGLKGVKQDLIVLPTLLNLSNNEVINRMIIRMKQHNFTDRMIKGVLGNAGGESGFNPEVISKDGYGSKHLLQWTGPRLKQLHQMYGDHPTVELLVDFMVHELNTSEKKAFNSLKNAQTDELAVESFMWDYERPNKRYANLVGRIKHMRKASSGH